jgi:DUF1680 family protein
MMSPLAKSLVLMLASAATSFAAEGIVPLPDAVPAVVADRQDAQVPDRVRLTGLIGSRIQANALNRLALVDPNRLLEGYRKRPGRQSWDGEHVGKWLHAATLAWVHTGDAGLRAKLDATVAELVKCQLEDGYLGTYVPAKRWTEWDVWAHKYNLIGLVTYMRYTGNREPLGACRKMADLLCETFGDAPGKRDIIKAGEHVGMAPTSVLEPMVWLHRFTGEKRYREFCEYLLRAWEQPNGPHIVSRLLELKRVDKVGNGKAYEMLSCLNGMLEWYRLTGDAPLLQAARNAWEDIVDKRLFITGTASVGEHFRGDYDLPNTGHIGETCVTVTWLQFNAHLLRLTGEARFAQQLERVVYNQLLGAQRPDGKGWGYYVELEGKKPYSESLDGHCCLSSGPRGVALVPTFALTTDADGVVVNLVDAGTADLRLRDGTAVRLAVETTFPASEAVSVAVTPAAAREFSVRLRIPDWCEGAAVRVDGQPVAAKAGADGYVVVRRAWKAGDRIALTLPLAPRVVTGDHKNAGKVAFAYGPLVLAADSALGAGAGGRFDIPAPDPKALGFTPEPATEAYRDWPGAQVFRVTAGGREARLAPFATAGCGGSAYRVWLPLGKAAGASGNVLEEGKESRSRQGNLAGSILEGEPVVTFDGAKAAEDWYEVTLAKPASIRRVVFAHGKTFHDGGWFDASGGKPKVQVRAAAGGEWKTVGEFADYPATTAAGAAGLAGGERFTCTLPEPVQAAAIRVVGRPAGGDAPNQAFSSCGGLQAFEK